MLQIRLFLLCCALWVSAPALAGIDVSVRGLGSEERDNAFAQLRILDYAKEVDASKGPDKMQYEPAEVQRLAAQGQDDIRKALQPFGWYNPVITFKLQGQAPDWKVVYQVACGPETDIVTLDLLLAGEGKDYGPLREILGRPRLRTGERLKHQDYEALKSRLLQAAAAGGYLDAAFSRHELRVDVEHNSAEVLLTLDTGPRWYFGAVSIEQDIHLHEKLLRRYISIVPGEPFDSAKVLKTQFALTDLDYFKLVEVVPHKDQAGPDRRIPLVIHMQSKPPRIYRLGAGYGTDTGPRALAGIEFRRLNDEGHKLRLTLQPSQNISTAIAEYRIPVGHQPTDSVSFTAEGLKQNFQGVQETLWSIGTAYNHQTGTWTQRDYLTFTNDEYNLPDEPGANSKLLTPGITLSHTQADDPISPRRGWFISMDLHGGARTLLSDTDFLEGLVKLRGVLPLGAHTLLYGRIEQGAVVASDFDLLPPTQRFFAGGAESVRGYNYNSLAPVDAAGNLVGGRFLTTGSIEADWTVYQNYGLALFCDAGGAADTPKVRLHYGAGPGFRYRLPFGAIAIDIAHPFDRGAEAVHLDVSVRVGL